MAGLAGLAARCPKLDGAGRPTWSYAAGGPGGERGLGIAADATGGL